MKLRSGDKIIDFNIEDINGNMIKLSEYNNKKVLLSFYRYASCPFCNLRVQELKRNYDNYMSKGLEIIAIFESPKESILKYAGSQDAPFPIIPDPERKLYKDYHIEKSLFKFIKGLFNLKLFKAALLGFLPGRMENDKTMVPADFLIEGGIIKQAYYGKDISNHIPLDDIKKFISK